jgi:transcriptional regulator with XRE-family HTH domain
MGRQKISLNPVAESAAVLLGAQIRTARHAKKWTSDELARRAGVSRITVLNTEAGSPSVSLGNALNLAALAGVPLFGIDDPVELAQARARAVERLALLPTRVDPPRDGGDGGDFDF